jgi:acetamidase/formamidase
MPGPYTFVLTCIVLGMAATAAKAQAGSEHSLPLAPGNVHWGHYDARIPPALRVHSGDRIYVETLVARGLERIRLEGVQDRDFTPGMLEVESAVTDRGPGSHPMTGPIWVEGAEPGDVLEVRILEVELLARHGVAAFLPGGGTLPGAYPYGATRIFELDDEAGVARLGDRIAIPLRPFFASIGVAPPLMSGRISSNPPGAHAGNLDNKELVPGTSLFLPVHVRGALLSVGDGHAAQGDGEVGGSAIEASLKGRIQVVLHKDRRLLWPRAETPTHFISMGFDTDLDEAARLATREMIDFLVHEKGMDPTDAYFLCTAALDLRITQLVNGTKGVHGMMPRDVVPAPRP